jgi:NADP-dependent 3-hydroxy acid dehydrogenase YdfG
MNTNATRVFITGGASGLGRALACAWLKQGASVLIGDINDTRAQAFIDEMQLPSERFAFLHVDVRDENSFVAAREWLSSHWDGLDILVNNAGVAASARIDRGSLEDWDWIFDINAKSVVRACRVFVPLFKQAGHGHIVNTASLAGLLNPASMASYSASKATVISLSETLRWELAPYSIHVTVVCPSFFQTNLHESMRSPEPGMVDAMKRLMASKELTAEQVADAILHAVTKQQFLLLPHASGRRAFALKKYLPSRFAKLMLKQSMSLKKKLGDN